MDDRLRVFIMVVASGGFCALLGAAFGAVSGAVYWAGGRSAGTLLGLSVARSLARAGGHDFSRTAQGAVVGAADGFVFLGVLGSLAGLFLAHGEGSGAELAGAAFGLAGLVGLAALFGLLGYAVVRAGVYAVVGLFAGGLGGGLLGAVAANQIGTSAARYFGWLVGAVLGVFAGTALSLLARRYAPHFTPPRPGGPRQHRAASTDVTGEGPHSPTRFTLPDEP